MNNQLFSEITNTVYSFGSPYKGPFGYVVLKQDGTVLGYQNKNETSWKLKEDRVLFYNDTGVRTSTLTYNKQLRSWFGKTRERKTPLYLHNLFSLKTLSKKDTNNIPSILLYGTTCNGSKLIESHLNECGWQPSNINIRNIFSINDLNYEPPKYIECPILPLLHLLNSQTVTGSFEDIKTLNDIRKENIRVLTVTKNIKNIILELFEIYLKTYNNTDNLANNNKIKLAEKFIAKYEKTLFVQMRGILRTIINDSEKIILRYEDFIKNEIPKEVGEVLNVWYPNITEKLTNYYHNVDISTFTTPTTEWLPPLEKIYRTTGLASYNHILGYLD
jgi:hypothetical protein